MGRDGPHGSYGRKESENVSNIYRHLVAICSADAPSLATYFNWVTGFASGNETVKKESSIDRPRTQQTLEMIRRLSQVISTDKRISPSTKWLIWVAEFPATNYPRRSEIIEDLCALGATCFESTTEGYESSDVPWAADITWCRPRCLLLRCWLPGTNHGAITTCLKPRNSRSNWNIKKATQRNNFRSALSTGNSFGG